MCFTTQTRQYSAECRLSAIGVTPVGAPKTAAGKRTNCSNCLPCRRGQCDNLPVTETDPENTPTTETRLVETNSEECDKVPVETTQTMSLVITSIPETQDINHSATFHSIGTSESPTTLEPNEDNSSMGDLPSFPTSSEPTFCWGELDGKTFSCALNGIYDEIVHWIRNLSNVPSGKAGTAFVRELSRIFRAYADGSALESMAIKAAMVMPALLLQKPNPRSKAKDMFSAWSAA